MAHCDFAHPYFCIISQQSVTISTFNLSRSSKRSPLCSPHMCSIVAMEVFYFGLCIYNTSYIALFWVLVNVTQPKVDHRAIAVTHMDLSATSFMLECFKVLQLVHLTFQSHPKSNIIMPIEKGHVTSYNCPIVPICPTCICSEILAT